MTFISKFRTRRPGYSAQLPPIATSTHCSATTLWPLQHTYCLYFKNIHCNKPLPVGFSYTTPLPGHFTSNSPFETQSAYRGNVPSSFAVNHHPPPATEPQASISTNLRAKALHCWALHRFPRSSSCSLKSEDFFDVVCKGRGSNKHSSLLSMVSCF